MARDSILDEAEKKDEQADETTADETGDANGSEGDRVRLTQRVPEDLLDEVDEVQEAYHLPSRNATINFMLTRSAEELLE